MKNVIAIKNFAFVFLSALLLLTVGSCKKGCDFCYNQGYCNNDVCVCPSGFSGSQCQTDNRPACEKYSTGTVIFDNFSSNPYDCYINSVYKGRVYGYGTLSVTTYSGYCSLRTLQASGYVVYPSEYIGSNTLPKCGTLTFSFP